MISRIFFIGGAPLDSMLGDTMESHVVSTLNSLNIEVEYAPIYFGGIKNRINRYLEIVHTDFARLKSTPLDSRIVKSAKVFKPDLILVLLGNYTTPSLIDRLRESTGAPAAVWCQDHLGTMGRQYIIGSKFDFVFAKDQFMVDLFKRYTLIPVVHYLPEACNPNIHRSVTLDNSDFVNYGCDVTTAATLYYYRSEIMEALTDFDLKIWGPVPRFYKGPLRKFATGKSVYMREKAACFNASKIVLNSLFPMEIDGLNARAFEIAGCGGFQLISHSEAVARHFVPDKEIVTFYNLDDLKDKVQYYLTHDSERQSIAQAGQLRAHSEHTYLHRLRQMLNVIEDNTSLD